MAARAVARQCPPPPGSAMLGAMGQEDHGEGQCCHCWLYDVGPSREDVCEAGASQERLSTSKELVRCISTILTGSSPSWASSTAMSQARSMVGQRGSSTVLFSGFCGAIAHPSACR